MIGASSRDNYPLTDDGAAYMFSLPTNKSKSLSSNSYLLADDFEIIISPNPFYNSINLKSNCVMDYTSIYDITGKLIKKDVCNSSEFNLNLNSLKAGTYILKTYCGKNNYTRKIVKLD